LCQGRLRPKTKNRHEIQGWPKRHLFFVMKHLFPLIVCWCP
jgi:hypothetical protein